MLNNLCYIMTNINFILSQILLAVVIGGIIGIFFWFLITKAYDSFTRGG